MQHCDQIIGEIQCSKLLLDSLPELRPTFWIADLPLLYEGLIESGLHHLPTDALAFSQVSAIKPGRDLPLPYPFPLIVLPKDLLCPWSTPPSDVRRCAPCSAYKFTKMVNVHWVLAYIFSSTGPFLQNVDG
jgi:hypothetical protein